MSQFYYDDFVCSIFSSMSAYSDDDESLVDQYKYEIENLHAIILSKLLPSVRYQNAIVHPSCLTIPPCTFTHNPHHMFKNANSFHHPPTSPSYIVHTFPPHTTIIPPYFPMILSQPPSFHNNVTTYIPNPNMSSHYP